MKKLLGLKIITILSIILIVLSGCNIKKDTKEEENNEDVETVNNTDETQVSNNEENESIAKNGYFVEYKGDTYFWKISSNSRETSGLYANYEEISGVKNSLVKLDTDGNEQTVLTDNGSGEIFIINDKIFLSYTNDNYGNSRTIYSVDLDGSNKKIYQQEGEMKYIVGNYLICETSDDKIFRINAENDEIENLVSNANTIGLIDDTIYYAKNDSYKTGKLEIGSITDKTDNGIIATFSKSNFSYPCDGYPIEAVDFFEDNGKIVAYIGYRAGSASLLQEAKKFEMDKDGKNSKVIGTISDDELIDEEKSTDEVYLKSVEENGSYKNNLMYVDQSTKERKIAMTQEELVSNLNITLDDEHMMNLYASNIVDDDLYVVLDNGIHNSAEDIGWRYSYKRTDTIYFKYNIKTNEVTKLYSF